MTLNERLQEAIKDKNVLHVVQGTFYAGVVTLFGGDRIDCDILKGMPQESLYGYTTHDMIIRLPVVQKYTLKKVTVDGELGKLTEGLYVRVFDSKDGEVYEVHVPDVLYIDRAVDCVYYPYTSHGGALLAKVE